MEIAVSDAPEQSRYEARDGSALAGLAAYRLTTRGLIVFTHTEVDPAYEGSGVGSKLARAALDDARERALRIVPRCPFIANWVTRHPEYQDLVYHPPATENTDAADATDQKPI